MTTHAKLVVLSGVHEGAIAAIETSIVLVGSAPTCDILLRDPGVRPLHASISVAGRTTIVREHAPVAAENEAAQAEQANRDTESETEWYAPFRIGPAWVVIAPANFDWGISEPLRSNARDGVGTEAAQGEDSQGGSPSRSGSGRLRALYLGLAAVCLGAMLAGLFAMVVRTPGAALPARQLSAAEQDSVAHLNRLIARLKLPNLTVEWIGGRPTVVGFVATREELASLMQATRNASVDGLLLRVQAGDEVARRAREFLDDRGIVAAYQGGGRVRLSGRPLETRSRAAIADKLGRLRADVGESVQIADELDYAEMEPSQATPTVRPMPIRIAEVQADAPAHFRTADGARYFVGATLPDGAQVVRIGGDEILFRRENRLIRYRVVE